MRFGKVLIFMLLRIFGKSLRVKGLGAVGEQGAQVLMVFLGAEFLQVFREDTKTRRRMLTGVVGVCWRMGTLLPYKGDAPSLCARQRGGKRVRV
jgi:hypothetical protein